MGSAGNKVVKGARQVSSIALKQVPIGNRGGEGFRLGDRNGAFDVRHFMDAKTRSYEHSSSETTGELIVVH